MDLVPAGGWQVVQEADGLSVLLAGAPGNLSDEELRQKLRQALGAQGVAVPPITVRRVEAIPRAALGKAPLIKSNVPR